MRLTLLFSIVLFTFFSCQNDNSEKGWKEIEVYDKLSKNPVFVKMKQMPEIIDLYYKNDFLLTRSAKVTYLRSRDKDFLEEYVDTVFNANVIIPHRDSLMVRISFSDGWAGNGVLLHIKRNQFNTNVFEFSDTQVVDEFGNVIEPKLTTKIYNQKLILDKHAYEVGDSIYGKINFNLMQVVDLQGIKDAFYYKGAGYFRAKIKKNYY